MILFFIIFFIFLVLALTVGRSVELDCDKCIYCIKRLHYIEENMAFGTIPHYLYYCKYKNHIFNMPKINCPCFKEYSKKEK